MEAAEGVHIRHCALTARFDFKECTVTGVSAVDVTLPMDFTDCSYEHAWSLFWDKEDEERQACGLPPLESRPSLDTIVITESSMSEEVTPAFSLPLATPHPEVCQILGIRVNDSPASFTVRTHVDASAVPRPGAIPFFAGDRHSLMEWSSNIPSHLGDQWHSDLLVAIPVSVLRQQLQRAYLAVKEAQKNRPDQTKVGNMAFSLTLKIEFKLHRPRPNNSPLYFISRSLRSNNQIKEYPMVVTSQRLPAPAGQHAWFPTVPHRVFSTVDTKTQTHYRVHWKLKLEVPPQYSVLAPGVFAQKQTLTDQGRKWTSYFFETKGESGMLLPSQIGVFIAELKLVPGESDILSPFSCAFDFVRSGRATAEDEDEDGVGGDWISDVPPALTALPRQTGAETRGKIMFATPPELTSLLRSTVSHMPKAIEVIQQFLKERQVYPLANFVLAFLPVDNNRNHSDSLLMQRRIGSNGGEEEMSSQALLEGLATTLPNTRQSAVSSPLSAGSRFWIFGNVIIFDIGLLHSAPENTEGTRLAKLAIIEGLLAYWFGGSILDVPPHKLAEDRWLLTGMRKYYTLQVHMCLFGRIDATIWLNRQLQLYCKLVEQGGDMVPLSSSKQMGPLTDLSPILQIKSLLVLVALECLVVSNSNGHYWLPAGFLPQVIQHYCSRLFARRAAPSTEKFFDRLLNRAKQVFVKQKLNKTALTTPTNAAPPQDDDGTNLDLSLYRSHPYYDVEEFVNDVLNFENAYVYGTGCPQVTIGAVVEVQKKTFQLESLKIRLEQTALQPPTPVLPKDETSHWTPVSVSALRALGHLLSSPDLITYQRESEQEALKQLQLQLTQCSQPLTFLEQLKFNLDAALYHPIELIARDQKYVLGFGYLGQTTSAICGGKGPHFNALVRLATSAWANLTPEQRSTMASDTGAMETLIAGLPDGVRVPVGATGGQPEWVIPLLAWQASRRTFSIQDVCPHVYAHPGVYADYARVRDWLRQTTQVPLPPSVVTDFHVELPESAGAAKFWPVVMRITLFEDTKATQHAAALRNFSVPSVITLREQGLKTTPGRPRSHNNAQVLGVPSQTTAQMAGGELFRFHGTQVPQGDTDMLMASCPEATRMLFAAGAAPRPEADPNAQPSKGQRYGHSGALQLLWMRPSDDSFILGRVRRFQSLSMWVHQLLNDTGPVAQAEAIEALGMCTGDPQHALLALKACVHRSKMHPYNRGLIALTLALITRTPSSSSAEEAFQILIKEVLPTAKSPGGHQMPISSKWMPPLFSAASMQYLMYVFTALSKVRDGTGDTPPEIFEAFEDCFTSLPSPVDLKVEASHIPRGPDGQLLLTPANADKTLPLTQFVASLVEDIASLSLTPVPVREAIISVEAANLVSTDPASESLWSFEWVSRQTMSLFQSIWAWVRMEQKFATGAQLVTRAFLRLVSLSPTMCLLARKAYIDDQQILFDPFRLFVPTVILLPPTLDPTLRNRLPPPQPDESGYIYLHHFSLAGSALLDSIREDPDADANLYFWTELLSAVSAAGHCLNYVDFDMSVAAIKTTLTLIIQGRLLPPPFLLVKTVAQILASPPAYEDLNGFFQIDHLYPLATGEENQSPLSCQWVDDFSRQQMLMRSGSAVLAAVRLVAQLEALLPFSDTHELIPRAWIALKECLEDALVSSPLALLPFSLESPESHMPLLTNTALMMGEVKPSKKQKKVQELDEESEVGQGQIATFHQEEDWISDEDVPAADNDDWAAELGLYDQEEESSGLGERQFQEDMMHQAPPPSMDEDAHKAKRRSGSRKKGDPVIIPPVIQTFELLFGYLHSIAAASMANCHLQTWAVSEVTRFLFGEGVPKPVQICRGFLQAWREKMSESDGRRLDAFLAENFLCLTPPQSASTKSGAKLVLKNQKAGLALKQIPAYEQIYVKAWTLSNKNQSWPLPLQLSWRSLAQKLTFCLMEHPSAIWFIHPVDAQQMPTYYRIIEHPIWLTKAMEMLKNKEYESFDHWKSDIFRIFRNCRIYNLPNTPVMLDCDSLQGLAYQLLHFAERLLAPYKPI